MTEDEQSIRALVATWHSSTAAGNVDGVLPLMAEDVVFLVAAHPPMRGRAAFEKGLRGLLATHRIQSESVVEEIEVAGALAYCWSSLKVTMTPVAGGAPSIRSGPALSILHRQHDRSWVIVREGTAPCGMASQGPEGSLAGLERRCRGVSFIGRSRRPQFQNSTGRKRMNRARNLSWLAVGIVAFVGSMAGFAQAASASADEVAIRAQSTSWEKAYNGGDAKAVAALYAEDAILLPPGASSMSGRAAILAYFTKDVANSKAAGAVFALNPKTDVGVSGNMAWESGTYKVTVKGAVVETGKFLSVSRKKDGKWLYIRDTWNADAPPAPPAPAAAPPAPATPPATPPAAPAPKK